jgi:hypothetical protein
LSQPAEIDSVEDMPISGIEEMIANELAEMLSAK